MFASGADRGEIGPVGEQTGGGRGAVQEDLELPHVLGGERAGERGSVATFYPFNQHKVYQSQITRRCGDRHQISVIDHIR